MPILQSCTDSPIPRTWAIPIAIEHRAVGMARFRSEKWTQYTQAVSIVNPAENVMAASRAQCIWDDTKIYQRLASP